MRILLTHPGTQYSYALAGQLKRLGVLYKFATGLAFAEASPQKNRWLPARFQKQKARRTVAGLKAANLHTQALLEIKTQWRLYQKKYAREHILSIRNERFQQNIPASLIVQADAVIGFDTSSRILIKRCKQAGKPFVLDASIAHPLAKEAIYARLRTRFPAWQQGLIAKAPQLIADELEEIENADHIVVASAFTRQTFLEQGIAPHKISVNGYGVDTGYFQPQKNTPKAANEPLVFLFFGALTARKGFPWLCEVWSRFHALFPATRLIAAGYGDLPVGFTLPEGVDRIGFIHPNDRLALFHLTDVFVFPSFFEGFAQVIVEAMACGLPVITTYQTAGPELISAGKEGLLITAGKDEELLNALVFFAENRNKIADMGAAAALRVQQQSWDAYGDRWQVILEKVVAESR